VLTNISICLAYIDKFDGKQVILRWDYIYTEFKKWNIVALSFGGDGTPE